MDWTINTEKTIENYNALFQSFLSSELLNTNALALSEKELMSLMERQSMNKGGISWFELTNRWFSICKLVSVIPVTNCAHPWTQLHFASSNSRHTISLSRFIYSSPVVFIHAGGKADTSQYKASKILGDPAISYDLGYFQKHVDDEFIYCYSFNTYNSFNYGSPYLCYRFAVIKYIREALLLTQGYIINYFLNHPVECFPGLVLEGSRGLLINPETEMQLINPIIEAHQDQLFEIKGRIYQNLNELGLVPEIL